MGDGPIPARIMLIGEFYGEEDARKGLPFQGASGQELNRMLAEAGILRSECYSTNVVNDRPAGNDMSAWISMAKKDRTLKHEFFNGEYVLPPVREGVERMWREIDLIRPNVILALGSWSLWALTGRKGILRWRGSMLETDSGVKVVPTLPPSWILRDWSQRAITVLDFNRAAKGRGYPGPWQGKRKENFLIRPSFQAAVDTLQTLLTYLDGQPVWIDFDVETKAKHITCAGLAWSFEDAVNIPFMLKDTGEDYWHEEEEGELVYLLYRVLTHPNVKVRGQNLLYDCQYTWRHWHFVPRVAQDTMISHHTCFAGLKKSLDFQASMYCQHYVQWKPEKTSWKDGG